MDIQVVSVSPPETVSKGGKAWQQVKVEFIGKNGPANRTIRSFEDIYKVATTLNGGDNAKVRVVKEGTFWNWKEIEVVGASDVPATTGSVSTGGAKAPAPAAAKGNWETSEERAAKQHYIVRQSSITAALSYLAGAADNVEDVLRIAKEFEDFVFSGEVPSAEKPAKAKPGRPKKVVEEEEQED